MPTRDKGNLFILFVPIFTLFLLSKIVYDHVAKSDLRKKTLQRYNSPTVANVFENKFRRVVEKSSDFFSCLLCFLKATKFANSSEYSDCVQNVWAISCLPIPFFLFFCRALKGLGTSLALQCYTALFSVVTVQETKENYSFFSFLYFLSRYLRRRNTRHKNPQLVAQHCFVASFCRCFPFFTLRDQLDPQQKHLLLVEESCCKK